MAKSMVDNVFEKRYTLTKTLKDSTRSMVYQIMINEQLLILKEPVEKNRRKWIRFTTLLRKPEALQSCLSMLNLQDIGISTNEPLVVVEKHNNGMVVDSWYLCSYVKGSVCTEESYPAVVNTLKKIHESGYLHGDPQIRNFLTNQTKIHVIDAKLKKAWNPVAKKMELVYLNKSALGINRYFDKSFISYKIAQFIMTINDKTRHFKYLIRKAFNS